MGHMHGIARHAERYAGHEGLLRGMCFCMLPLIRSPSYTSMVQGALYLQSTCREAYNLGYAEARFPSNIKSKLKQRTQTVLRSKRTPTMTPIVPARSAQGQLPSQQSWTNTFAYDSPRILSSLWRRARLVISCIASGNKSQRTLL